MSFGPPALSLALAALLGCASCASSTASRASNRSSSPSPGLEASLPEALRPAPNSPRVCYEIGSSPGTRDVNQAVIAMASGDTAAVGRLKDAATGLRTLAESTPDADVHAALVQAAAAVDALAHAGASDQAALAHVSDALTKLGKEMQGRCHYPVG